MVASKAAAADQLVEEQFHPKRPSEMTFKTSDKPTIDILNGNRFMICSRTGDMDGEEHGVFCNDTRFLSLYKAKINGGEPTILTSNNTTHYSAGFYLTNPELPVSNTIGNINNDEEKLESIPKDSLAIHRMRFIEEDVREEYLITNVSETKFPFTLSFDVDSDFADIFDVKLKAFGKRTDIPQKTEEARGRNVLRERCGNRRHISRVFTEQENAFDLSYTNYKSGFQAETLVWFSKRGRVDGSKISFDILLEPNQTHHLTIVIVILTKDEKRMRRYTERYFQNQEEKIARALEKWHLKIPRLDTNWDELRHSYYEGLVDLVSLKMGDPVHQYHWELPAAGCPWFMTIFGRDTLITSYQSMLFGSNLAMGAIEALAEYQANEVDKSKDEEPGKIIHELRFGDYAASSKRFPYYGTADATSLFLILISEIYRWTKNIEFLNSHRKNIMSALSWIDNYGDKDKDGFVEYKKKAEDGLDNQCWKDSWNSIQFSNGKIAEPPIADCEIQGYVYDAKTRIAEIAKQCWMDDSLAKKLIDEANDLKELFNERFWQDEKGYYALALDKDKKQVDALTSNNGHLLWSGIVDEDKVDSVVKNIMSESMFSGYGLRTLSTNEKGYSPIGYHTGCVWPHDNSIIAFGLSKYGRNKEANKIIDSMLGAAPHFGYTLPETFAGFPKLEKGFPVRYPTSSSPQAWAAGASLLFFRTLMGISPSVEKENITVKPIFQNKDTFIELWGIEAFGKKFNISLQDGSSLDVYQTHES